PSGVIQTISLIKVGGVNILAIAAFLVIAVLVIAAIIYINEGQRRIPVQYAKRVVGRRVYGGQSTHIPLKLNQAGVIPVIFASSILLFPATIAQFFAGNGFSQMIVNLFSPSSVLYNILYALLIIFFTYFYTAIVFNPVEMADNLKKYSGFIPGIRPGRPTSEYIEKVVTRITLAGAVFLAFVAVLPSVIIGFTGVQTLYLGGTGLLIVVGVTLDTMRQLESQLMMKQYEGFMK
ncbi:MAG: preprotein translocase subunit SecY, partial [bacterium]